MDPVTLILTVTTVFLGLFSASEAKKRKEAQSNKRALFEEVDSVKGKLDAARKELGKTKDTLSQKTKALEEARNLAKKKDRREAKANQRLEKESKQQSQTQDKGLMQEEIKKLKASLDAMEHQVITMKKELDVAKSSANEEAANKWGEEIQQAKAKLEDAENKANTAFRELENYKAKTEEEKAHKAKYPTPLDLDSLDKDVVNELARYFRKSEHYERLYHVTQGHVRVAQDKAADLQRRYREVCRELALVAGSQKSDQDAVAAAEAIVAKVATDEKHEARYGKGDGEESPNGSTPATTPAELPHEAPEEVQTSNA